QPVPGVVQLVVPGASMRGPRPNDFGSLADRTYQICAPSDSICDAPHNIGNAAERAMELIEANGIHALYASNDKVIPGMTTNQWVVGWASKRSEEHTSELQSRFDLVCRLLLVIKHLYIYFFCIYS